MRKLLAHTLVLLVLLPSLVCAMPLCEELTTESSTTAGSHCDEAPRESSTKSTDAIMLFVDCMGVELLRAPDTGELRLVQASSEYGADADPDIHFGAFIGQPLVYPALHAVPKPRSLRAPLRTGSPLYLTTHRIRI